ncbi:MAG: ASCH domain-containing protein [Phycisphaerales bacterium]|nr:ASCH domain-containing protein [Phycisphaerales bacterium]MCI0676453.1 ASCH domain-containing protein [Phycisphaerales bacterium]
MLALSIRQPYAELILRGVKTIEYRSRPTRLISQRFYIYASKKWAGVNGTNGDDADALTLPSPRGRGLPTGVIVGTAVISECRRNHTGYEWHLSNVKRLPKPRKPKRMPQPVWFRPF